jgi:hypothetical protein
MIFGMACEVSIGCRVIADVLLLIQGELDGITPVLCLLSLVQVGLQAAMTWSLYH